MLLVCIHPRGDYWSELRQRGYAIVTLWLASTCTHSIYLVDSSVTLIILYRPFRNVLPVLSYFPLNDVSSHIL